jgi:hypothetical protein
MLAEIQFAKDNTGYTPSFKRRGGGSATFKAPEGPDTEWRDGERYGTEELYNKKTGEPMGKVRPVGQAPKTPKELGPSGLTDAELTLGTKLGGKFEDSQAVKDYVTMSAPVTFVNGLSDKDATGADDQALIYAFAQGMDPRSNVKEGEYDTISRTSLGWFERLGVNAQRVATGAGILTPRARADLKRTLNARYAAVEKQYSSMRSQAITQIDDFLGKGAGERFIPKYGMSGVAPSASPAPPAQAAGITNIHENPQTGERIGWNGSAWVPVK